MNIIELARKIKLIPTVYFKAVVGVVLMMYVTSCGIADAINNIAKSIDNAVAVLDVNSEEWQQTLTDLLDTAIADGSSAASALVRHEVTELLERGVAAVGGEFRCNVDFLADRIRQRLIRLKGMVLGQMVAPTPPAFCMVVPSAIETSLVPGTVPFIDFYGYDFDFGILEIYVEGDNGSLDDVTADLDIPTHYNMTLNLGANGVQLDSNSKRIVLYSSEIVPSPYDCNGNGRVDTFDIGVLEDISMGIRDKIWCAMADVNRDGAITQGELHAALADYNGEPTVLSRTKISTIGVIQN